MNFRSKRQQFTKQVRKQHRNSIFALKRSKFQQQITANYLKQDLLVLSTDLDKIQILKSLPPFIRYLDQQKLNVTLQLSLYYLSNEITQQISTQCLVQLTSLKSIPSSLKQKVNLVVSYIIQVLKTTSNIQVFINCIYIYGNLISDNPQIITFGLQVLAIGFKIWKNGQKKVQQFLTWLIQNTIFTLMNCKQQKKYNLDAKTYGQFSLEVLFQLIQQALKCQLVNKNQVNKSLILHYVSILKLIVSINYFNKDIFINKIDRIVTNITIVVGCDNIIMGQIVELLCVTIKLIGLTKGFCQIINAITNNIILVNSGLQLCSLINQLGVAKLKSQVNLNQFILQMNSNIIKNQILFFNNTDYLINQKYRSILIRYLLNYNKALTKINIHYIINIIELGLLDASSDNIIDTLRITQFLVDECQNINSLSKITELFQQTSILKTLYDLQLNNNVQIYEIATQILNTLRLENDEEQQYDGN